MPIRTSKSKIYLKIQVVNNIHPTDSVLNGAQFRHSLVRMQFYDMPWLGCSFTTCPCRDAVFRHTRVGRQFYDMYGQKCNINSTKVSYKQHGSLIYVQECNTHNTELQMVKVHINNTKHITIANIYIPPRNSSSTHYKTADDCM